FWLATAERDGAGRFCLRARVSRPGYQLPGCVLSALVVVASQHIAPRVGHQGALATRRDGDGSPGRAPRMRALDHRDGIDGAGVRIAKSDDPDHAAPRA